MSGLVSMRSCVHSVSNFSCPRFLRGLAMGTKYALSRRPSAISSVMPSSENRKCRVGSSNGELRIGFSMTTGGTGAVYGSAEPDARTKVQPAVRRQPRYEDFARRRQPESGWFLFFLLV